MKEKEGEDGDGGSGYRALAIRESVRAKYQSLMSLLQNISFRDKGLLSGRMGRAPDLTWFVRLIFDQIQPILILVFGVLSW